MTIQFYILNMILQLETGEHGVAGQAVLWPVVVVIEPTLVCATTRPQQMEEPLALDQKLKWPPAT